MKHLVQRLPLEVVTVVLVLKQSHCPTYDSLAQRQRRQLAQQHVVLRIVHRDDLSFDLKQIH
jgi:hypothetical protein